MALKLVRKKKAKLASGRQKKSEIEKFKDAIDVQLRLASGEKVEKGRGIAKSWMVLVPRVGNRRLYGKSAITVDMKQKKPPTNELEELRKLVADRKLIKQIYRLRKRKAVAAKKK